MALYLSNGIPLPTDDFEDTDFLLGLLFPNTTTNDSQITPLTEFIGINDLQQENGNDSGQLDVIGQGLHGQQYMRLIWLMFIFVFGVPGNALVVLVQMKNKRKLTTDYLVMTMASFELICSFVNTSIQFVQLIPSIIFGTVMCRLMSFSSYVTSNASAMFLAAIAIDRFIKTCCPFFQRYNVLIAKCICVFISVVCTALCLPTLIYFSNDTDSKRCTIPDYKVLHIWHTSLTILVVVEFVIIALCYVNISLFLKKQHQRFTMRHSPKSFSSQETNSTLVSASSLVMTVSKGSCPTNQSVSDVRVELATDLTKTDALPKSKTRVKSNNGEDKEHRFGVFDDFDKLGDDVDNNTKVACITGPEGNRNTTSTRQKRTKSISMNQQRRRYNINTTTRVTFLISLIFTITWSTASIVMITNYKTDKILRSMGSLLIMTNCVTNPLLFIIMSSKFRESAKRVLCSK